MNRILLIPSHLYTLHWFSDIGEYNLDDFVGNNVIIWYWNDLEDTSLDWNGNEYSEIRNLELR